ncbi:hypothetical protein EZV73_00085 [Acidaminobacter sp. JC074]|uniref:hypothetical protein n=1 Tax=Acidaminobacter sp. JC074 TaxID=2530199 RepID=UPI001F10B66E|nr:hypothetical protein [Acidaminobacter sp. JC074]MCH4885936.1 hypothetical protein [Acidaminobacter sp. JC074]
MRYCAFCNEKIPMTKDYCLRCGNSRHVKEKLKGTVNLNEYLEALKVNGITDLKANDYHLDIRNWKMPVYLEFGIHVERKPAIKEIVISIMFLLIVSLLYILKFSFLDAFVILIWPIVAIFGQIMKIHSYYICALKFENPFHLPGHEVRYNRNNINGGRGLEEFVLKGEELNDIYLKYNGQYLTTIEFGDSSLSVELDGFSRLDLLEKFIILYSIKHNKQLTFEG